MCLSKKRLLKQTCARLKNSKTPLCLHKPVAMNENGNIKTVTKDIAEILNKQFESVFDKTQRATKETLKVRTENKIHKYN